MNLIEVIEDLEKRIERGCAAQEDEFILDPSPPGQVRFIEYYRKKWVEDQKVLLAAAKHQMRILQSC